MSDFKSKIIHSEHSPPLAERNWINMSASDSC
jgi:hypothetical protein